MTIEIGFAMHSHSDGRQPHFGVSDDPLQGIFRDGSAHRRHALVPQAAQLKSFIVQQRRVPEDARGRADPRQHVLRPHLQFPGPGEL